LGVPNKEFPNYRPNTPAPPIRTKARVTGRAITSGCEIVFDRLANEQPAQVQPKSQCSKSVSLSRMLTIEVYDLPAANGV